MINKGVDIRSALLNTTWVGCWLTAGTEIAITDALAWPTIAFTMVTGICALGLACTRRVIQAIADCKPAPSPRAEKVMPLIYAQGYDAGLRAGGSSGGPTALDRVS